MMKLIKYPSKEQWAELLKRPALNTESLFDTVRTIINKVRAEGDKAVLEYEAAFDKVILSALTVTSEEIQKAEGLISDELKSAITLAKRNIETFHSSQRFVGKKVETMEGVTCWQKAVGIEKVGLYIPGGTAPLFSTVLMLAVPAKIAGCREIVLCTPPDKNGNIHPAILFAAQLAGVSKIFKAGGVQAIAAMAYGTESVPKVYKIFGPGNQYVTIRFLAYHRIKPHVPPLVRAPVNSFEFHRCRRTPQVEYLTLSLGRLQYIANSEYSSFTVWTTRVSNPV